MAVRNIPRKEVFAMIGKLATQLSDLKYLLEENPTEPFREAIYDASNAMEDTFKEMHYRLRDIFEPPPHKHWECSHAFSDIRGDERDAYMVAIVTGEDHVNSIEIIMEHPKHGAAPKEVIDTLYAFTDWSA